MNLQQLRSFLTLAETGSFRRAAERLNTPQPTLSARIKTLEEAVGEALFDRGRAGAQLTQAGHRFRRYAEIAVTSLERGRALARLPSGTAGRVSIGLQNYLLSSLGPHLVRSLPTELALRIEPEFSDALVRQVSGGLLDLAVVFIPRLTSDLDVRPVGSQEVVLVATPDAASQAAPRLESYVEVYWGEGFLDLQAEAFDSGDLPRLSVGSPELALTLILERGGSAYLDRRMVQPALQSGQLGMVPNTPVFRRPVYTVRAPGRMSPAIDQAGDCVARWSD
ncbi:MAG: LysR family transcriptional regulator [Pseudomonadota bacterium]